MCLLGVEVIQCPAHTHTTVSKATTSSPLQLTIRLFGGPTTHPASLKRSMTIFCAEERKEVAQERFTDPKDQASLLVGLIHFDKVRKERVPLGVIGADGQTRMPAAEFLHLNQTSGCVRCCGVGNSRRRGLKLSTASRLGEGQGRSCNTYNMLLVVPLYSIPSQSVFRRSAMPRARVNVVSKGTDSYLVRFYSKQGGRAASNALTERKISSPIFPTFRLL